MIRSVRVVRAPRLDAHVSNTALVHTHTRLHAVENTRVVNEDLLLLRAYRRAGRLERPTVTVLLDGEARITAYGQHVWLAPGDVIAVDSRGEIRMRQAGARYASLAFEWDPGFVGGRGRPIERWRADARAMDRLREVWAGVRGEEPPAALIETLLATLAETGVPVERKAASEIEQPASEQMRAVAHALDGILSNLAEQPMMRDLAEQLGLSVRQVNRLVAEYNERYAFNSAGWIDTRNRRRVMIGATFMTVPGSVAQDVARLVGYRSAAAFTRALRAARLPPPTAISEEVEVLAAQTGRLATPTSAPG